MRLAFDRFRDWAPWALAALLAVIGLAFLLSGCEGPRTAEVEARLDGLLTQLETKQAELEQARVDDPTGDRVVQLVAELTELRARALETMKELGQARADDTKDAVLELPQLLVELLILGGGGWMLNKRRTSTRQQELAHRDDRLYELETQLANLKGDVDALGTETVGG